MSAGLAGGSKRCHDVGMRSRVLWAIAATGLLASACGSGTAAQPPAAASQARTASPAPVAAALGFTCRLPVVGGRSDLMKDSGAGYAGGWLTIPGPTGATVAVDPSTLSPAGSPTHSWAYDAAVGKWVPTSRQAVAPDGLSYAYIEYVAPGGDQRVHVVDVPSGRDKTLVSGSDLDDPVFTTNGIYLVHHLIGTDASNGLVRVDPVSGAQQSIPVPALNWGVGWRVDSGAAWATDFDPRSDPNAGAGWKMGQDRLLRFDLETKALTTWYDEPGRPLGLLAFDPAGSPVVVHVANQWASAVGVIEAAGAERTVWTAPPNTNVAGAGSDSHGTWLITLGAGTVFVPRSGGTAVPATDYSAAGTTVAGPCVS